MTMKMRLKMKNRLHKEDINRPRLRHGQKYVKHKMSQDYLAFCIKQHLSNI